MENHRKLSRRCDIAIYRLGDRVPRIADDAYVHPEAVIIGDVTLGPQSSVWPCAVLRGDTEPIEVGAGTSIQDGTVIHSNTVHPTVIGARCVVGHCVHIEGATVGDDTMIGSGAIVLPGARIGANALVGAGAVILVGKEIPAFARATGVPATVTPDVVAPQAFARSVASYIARGHRYRTELERIG